MIPLQSCYKSIAEGGKVGTVQLIKVVSNLIHRGRMISLDDPVRRRGNATTFVRKVCAANNFAASGASGDSKGTLQVDHASD